MNFTELEVCKEARMLVKLVYDNLNEFPQQETYGLQSQIKRSVISIPSNIAEGCGRYSIKDSLQFYYIARGSIFELETQLYLSSDLNFLINEQLITVLEKVKRVKALLTGFINHHKKQII
jgi:four helix bundle protein